MLYLTSFRVTMVLHLMHKSSENLLHPMSLSLWPAHRNYPQSNGCVENTVKTAKHQLLMKKSKEADADFYLALLDWRNTPTEGVGSSPMQKLWGQRTRILLPATPSLLESAVLTGTRDKLLKNRGIQTHYYNRGTPELPPLHTGDAVRMLPNARAEKWVKA